MRARNKKPGAVSRPGGWRSFGEYAFLEDSRYASQENYEGNVMWRNFLAFSTGVRAVGVDSTGATQEEEIRLKSAYKD
jgi:hypothetical protein